MTLVTSFFLTQLLQADPAEYYPLSLSIYCESKNKGSKKQYLLISKEIHGSWEFNSKWGWLLAVNKKEGASLLQECENLFQAQKNRIIGLDKEEKNKEKNKEKKLTKDIRVSGKALLPFLSRTNISQENPLGFPVLQKKCTQSKEEGLSCSYQVIKGLPSRTLSSVLNEQILQQRKNSKKYLHQAFQFIAIPLILSLGKSFWLWGPCQRLHTWAESMFSREERKYMKHLGKIFGKRIYEDE